MINWDDLAKLAKERHEQWRPISQFHTPISPLDGGRTPEICFSRIQWWNLNEVQFSEAARIGKDIFKQLSKENGTVSISDEDFSTLVDIEWISYGKLHLVKNKRLLS